MGTRSTINTGAAASALSIFIFIFIFIFVSVSVSVSGCDTNDSPLPGPDLGQADAAPPSDGRAPDATSPDLTPVLPAFGERCTPGAADACQSGLVCLTFTGQASASGVCVAPCTTTKDCPASPANAECQLYNSGKSYCGFICDGANPRCPNGLGCAFVSGQGGPYVCTGDAPPSCQNGKLEAGEACDGALLDDLECKAFGFTGGTLACSSSCTYDTGGCTGTTACKLPARDCTAGGAACAKLEEQLPRTGGDGFVVTSLPLYTWLRHDTFLLAKYAAAAVACMMPGSWPIGLSDASEQDGSTPKDPGGSLRHPQGTHERGLDLDVAYYQTGQTDNNPRAVCPHLVQGVSANHCTAAPDILDVKRSAYFIAKLFESGRVRVIGVDGRIGPLLQAEAEQLNKDHLVGTRTLTLLKKRLVWETTNTGKGWFFFHHTHLHLSSLPVYYGGS